VSVREKYNFICDVKEPSLTLKEGHREGVFEKRALRGIFGPVRESNMRLARTHKEELLVLLAKCH
jgi:hypothetical protein